MLTYHPEWPMRRPLAPLLFDDHDRAAAEARRASPVAKADPSPAALRKARSKRTDTADMPVHSFRSLLADFATLTPQHGPVRAQSRLQLLAATTAIQCRAFELRDIQPAAVVRTRQPIRDKSSIRAINRAKFNLH